MSRVRVCFVCLGNICRSPTAEAIFRRLVDEAGLSASFVIESAGTGDWHVGEPPDARSTAAARARGTTLTGRAAHFDARSFERFDHVIAMDADNRANLLRLARRPEDRAKIELLRNHDPRSPRDAGVPDPYYGEDDGFARVYDVCLAGCEGLLAALCAEHGL